MKDVIREMYDPQHTGYPYLAALLGGYFHQDFDIFGSTLEEIITTAKSQMYPTDVVRTASDLERFLKITGADDKHLASELERVFQPGVIIEGWENLTTRQWLERMLLLLKA